jgi:Ca2+-binding RTX toxin-like protein
VSGLSTALTINQAEATDTLTIQGLGGNDFINATGFPVSTMKLVLDGADGNDVLAGGADADTFFGGNGNDIVAGRQGNDVAFLGAGDDTFVWNPGDGSDIVEGQDGTDVLGFRAAAVNEVMDVSANGGRVLLTRDIGNIVMDLDDVEQIDINALAGTDTIAVHDVTGTDLKKVNIDLAGALGGTTTDGQADQVIVQGTNGDDVVQVSSANGVISITGLAAVVNITHADGGLDVLKLQMQGGADVINASGLAAGQMLLQIEGGLGNDLVIGSAGNDLVFGGDGDDTALLGAGDDKFVWNPGDDNDIVEGQDGFDTLQFNGANIAEKIDIDANGGRVRFTRDVATVTMDLNDVERIEFNALGGADTIKVHDLSGTDVTQVVVNLAGTIGGAIGDGAVDQVIADASNGDNQISITAAAGVVSVSGLPGALTINQAESTDSLTVQGLGGNDFINATGFPASTMKLTLDGGAGDDTLAGGTGADTFIGGDGNDLVVGRQGDDVANLGAGDDTFVWNPGDGNDIVEGGDGNDGLGFRGAAVNEIMDIAANGGRVRMTRDVANIVMDTR